MENVRQSARKTRVKHFAVLKFWISQNVGYVYKNLPSPHGKQLSDKLKQEAKAYRFEAQSTRETLRGLTRTKACYLSRRCSEL